MNKTLRFAIAVAAMSAMWLCPFCAKAEPNADEDVVSQFEEAMDGLTHAELEMISKIAKQKAYDKKYHITRPHRRYRADDNGVICVRSGRRIEVFDEEGLISKSYHQLDSVDFSLHHMISSCEANYSNKTITFVFRDGQKKVVPFPKRKPVKEQKH